MGFPLGNSLGQSGPLSTACHQNHSGTARTEVLEAPSRAGQPSRTFFPSHALLEFLLQEGVKRGGKLAHMQTLTTLVIRT